eukprot:TRINITY_DN35309_c0_g1_i1.p1 TRINITY_DN35309_c0_g1~~TRINITY_DN35309_c0_g1_i1.p1  ORF type:complete len:126 (-),score=17.38 TRINITY_DN35309_c0_g1_i1:194-571(-)
MMYADADAEMMVKPTAIGNSLRTRTSAGGYSLVPLEVGDPPEEVELKRRLQEAGEQEGPKPQRYRFALLEERLASRGVGRSAAGAKWKGRVLISMFALACVAGAVFLWGWMIVMVLQKLDHLRNS